MNPYGIAWKLLGGAIILGVFAYAWSQFTGHYVEQGVAKQLAIDTPKIEALGGLVAQKAVEYTKLAEATNKCNASVDAIAAESDKRISAGRVALAEKEKSLVQSKKDTAWYASKFAEKNTDLSCTTALNEMRAR